MRNSRLLLVAAAVALALPALAQNVAQPVVPTPAPGPVVPPKPPAPSFSEQIRNLMRTGQEWLFQSVLNVIVKPLMPILTFLAWIIASFVLIFAFIRRFHDNRGIGPEQLHIKELLDRGIDVYTTLNVQHILGFLIKLQFHDDHVIR